MNPSMQVTDQVKKSAGPYTKTHTTTAPQSAKSSWKTNNIHTQNAIIHSGFQLISTSSYNTQHILQKSQYTKLACLRNNRPQIPSLLSINFTNKEQVKHWRHEALRTLTKPQNM